MLVYTIDFKLRERLEGLNPYILNIRIMTNWSWSSNWIALKWLHLLHDRLKMYWFHFDPQFIEMRHNTVFYVNSHHLRLHYSFRKWFIISQSNCVLSEPLMFPVYLPVIRSILLVGVQCKKYFNIIETDFLPFNRSF